MKNTKDMVENETNIKLDPYEISPSGDEFWSYPENVKKLEEAIKEAHDPNRKIVAVLKSEEDIRKFFAEL